METWDGGAEAAAGVAELMAAELGWDDAERARQISRLPAPGGGRSLTDPTCS